MCSQRHVGDHGRLGFWFSNRVREIDRLLQFLATCLERQRNSASGRQTIGRGGRDTDLSDRDRFSVLASTARAAPSAQRRVDESQKTSNPHVAPSAPRHVEESQTTPNRVSTPWGKLVETIARTLAPEVSCCAKGGDQATLRLGRTAPALKCAKTECGEEAPITKEVLTLGLKAAAVRCGACGAPVVAVRWRLGDFVGCSTFPQCRWSRSWSGLRSQLRG